MRDIKPSANEIYSELVPHLRTQYEPLFYTFDEDERFYELEFLKDLKLPQEFAGDGTVLPTSRDMVDTFTDHIDIANVRVYTNRKGTSKISLEEAEMMRKVALGIIYRTNVEADLSPWRIAAKHFALHGLGVLKTVWDADRWPDKPAQKEGEAENEYAQRLDEWRQETHLSLPIVITAVHPRHIMPDPSSLEKEFVVEESEKLLHAVSMRWPRWTNPLRKKLNETVRFTSYWDRMWRADFADGEPLLPVRGGVVKHNYGFIPYVFFDSGLGNIPVDGQLKKRYVGLLRYMFDILKAESRDYSISDIILKKAAWPWGIISGDNAAAVGDITQAFGHYTVVTGDVKVEEKSPKVPPSELMQQFLTTSDIISAHAAPRVLRGMGESGVRSRVDREIVIAQAGLRYSYSSEAFRNGTAKALINCAKLIKNVIPGDVRLWARTPTDEFDMEIDKNLMKEPFNFYVEFAPISEEDEYRRHDDLERMVQSGLVTKRWARTQMSNVDAQAMERDEERERLKEDPQIQALLSAYAQELIKQAISQRIGAGPPTTITTPPTPEAGSASPTGPAPIPLPGGLIPQAPMRARPGSAEEAQLMLEKMRSQMPMSPTQGMGGGGPPRRT